MVLFKMETPLPTVEELQDRIGRLEADIAYLSTHDALTGLLSRIALLGELDTHYGRSGAPPKGAMVEVAIRNMPRISGTLGRHVADYVIAALAARLNQMPLPASIRARLSHDQFGIFLPEMTDALQAMSITKAIVQNLSRPVDWLDRTFNIELAAGVALASDIDGDPSNLLNNAELALRTAGLRGGSGYAFFNPALARTAKRRSDVQQAIHDGLEQNHFAMHYQPIFAAKSRALLGFEALMRLHDPRLGAIPPGEFIAVAEESALINRLGAWALAEACRVAANWPAHLTVAVNISPEQFYSGTLTTDLHHALELSSFPASRLELEVTESTMLKDADHVLTQLNEMHAMGCPITLDDFGTGYSSLSYLWKFPFSKIKIDRAFIAALDATPLARGILKAVFDLSGHIGLKVTAEGIEHEAHAAALTLLGADELQGFLLGKPVPQTELAALIIKHNAPAKPAGDAIQQAG